MEGYALCPCGTWVINEVARRTEGRCVPCYQTHVAPRLHRLELVGDGARIQIPRSERRRKPKRDTPQRAARRKLARDSRDAARKRLSAMLPDLYDVVLAEERAKRGLDPLPVQIAIRGGTAEHDLRAAELLATLTRREHR